MLLLSPFLTLFYFWDFECMNYNCILNPQCVMCIIKFSLNAYDLHAHPTTEKCLSPKPVEGAVEELSLATNILFSSILLNRYTEQKSATMSHLCLTLVLQNVFKGRLWWWSDEWDTHCNKSCVFIYSLAHANFLLYLQDFAYSSAPIEVDIMHDWSTPNFIKAKDATFFW